MAVTQKDWDDLNRKVIKAFCSTEERVKNIKGIDGLERSLKFAIKLEEYEICELIKKEIKRRTDLAKS